MGWRFRFAMGIVQIASNRRRKQALFNQRRSDAVGLQIVHIEQLHDHAADCSPSHDDWAVPTKVSSPPISPRVEKACQLASRGVEAGNIWALETVAPKTR